jgi:hypothetical protein
MPFLLSWNKKKNHNAISYILVPNVGLLMQKQRDGDGALS